MLPSAREASLLGLLKGKGSEDRRSTTRQPSPTACWALSRLQPRARSVIDDRRQLFRHQHIRTASPHLRKLHARGKPAGYELREEAHTLRLAPLAPLCCAPREFLHRAQQGHTKCAMAGYGVLWPDGARNPVIQGPLHLFLWLGLVAYGLRIVVHTGEVQGSIPCAPTITSDEAAQLKALDRPRRMRAGGAVSGPQPQIANIQTATMTPNVARPLMVQPVT
jgi:hypothetical protein